MKKIQKCLIALLVFCLTAGALVACGEGSDTTAGSTAGTPSTTAPTNTNQTNPTEPSAEPTAPSAEPTDPSAEPTDPSAEPTNGNDPTEPTVPSYKFTVVYGDTGLPAEEIPVQLCRVDPYVCLFPKYTDENGQVEYDLPTGFDYDVYQIHIIEDELPEGYTFDNEALLTSADVYEYTLTLVKEASTEPEPTEPGCTHIFVGENCTLCGEPKTYTFTVITKYPDVTDNVDKDEVVTEPGAVIPGVKILITDGNKMIAQGVTDEDGRFSFVAPKFASSDGLTSYLIVIVDGAPEGYAAAEDNSFVVNSLECKVEFFEEIVQEEYTALNPKPLVIGSSMRFNLPGERMDDADDPNADIWFLTPHDDSFYYFSVTPSKPEDVGHYKVTITGVPEGVTLYLGHFPSTHASVTPVATVYDIGENPTIEFNMQEKSLKDSTGAWTYDNSWLFGVRVEGDAEYPVEFEIKVERERDIIPGVDVVETVRETVQMVEGAKPATEVIGDTTGKTLTAISYNAASGIKLVLGEDGYYHIGSADGAILLVNITKNNPLLGGEVSFVTVNAESGTENLLISYIRDEMHHEVYYYASMLKEYAQLCNEDGVYPVNEQLYTFLLEWTNQRASSQIIGSLEKEQAFLLACAYYA